MASGTSFAVSASAARVTGILDRALAGADLTEADAIALIQCAEANLADVLDAAS